MDHFDNIRVTLANESRRRRLLHPDWPSYNHKRVQPDGKTLIKSLEITPTEKIDFIGQCRHCHVTHSNNWWMMDQRNFAAAGYTMLLCGYCEGITASQHASLSYTANKH